MEERSKSKLDRFTYWFENIFWFHHKWKYMMGVLAIALVFCVVLGIITAKHYDMTVVYAHRG